MIMKMHHTDINSILVPFISFFFMFSWISMATSAQNTTIQVKVGVILDFDSASGKNAKVYLSCMEMALADFYASNPYYKTRLVLRPRNSRSVVGAAAAAVDLINNEEVKAIIGPRTSMEANFLINMGAQAQVPILTFSASSPALTSLGSSYFFRFTQNDLIQVKAISGIVQNFGWRQVVPIHEDTFFGEGIIPYLIDALQEVEAHVPYRSVVSLSATDDEIENKLNILQKMPTRVFIVHMNPDLCAKLFAKAKEIGMMNEGFVWITTSGISNRLMWMSITELSSMEGVLGIQTYIRRTPKCIEFENRWKNKFRHENLTKATVAEVKLDVYAFQAYDAVSALARAVEQVGNTSIENRKGSDSLKATNLISLKISQYGTKLVPALSGTRFEGLAGDFNVVEGELQPSTYKIVNVIGGEAKKIALWTPEKGMVSTITRTIYTNSKCIFGPVKWPGNSFCVPKGWEIPTKGKKLRIGVPVKNDFTEFVNISKDPNTTITGFCIDVFNAAVELLPYELPHEFIPFENSNGLMAGTYNDLVNQVFLEKFDIVVGDTTITANRSLYVDFTMPYTKSDIGMVMPISDTSSKNAWIFMKPLTWSLWLTILCFFIFIGFVVWVLEHRVNADFRGPLSHQVGTSFWFSFSTMVFSNRERVVSNLARFLMIVWVFVMLILTQSYTASLSSLLTVQQLSPAGTDLNVLLRNGDNVGYIENAFAREVLYEIGFNDSRLKVIKSAKDGDKELSRGTARGGIAALVAETPTLDVFVAKYCSKYTMVGPIAKTNGFAFVFPKRSPLVADMSSAILNVTEGKNILEIEAKWIKKQSNCQNAGSGNVSGNSLGLESFWGLFLVAGVTSVVALIIFFTSFLYKHKHVWMSLDSSTSTWERIRAVCELFDDRDASFNTLRSSQSSDRANDVGDHGLNPSPTINWPESPFSYTNHGDLHSAFRGQQKAATRGASSPVRSNS